MYIRFLNLKIIKKIRFKISNWPWYQHYPEKNFLIFYTKLRVRVLISFISDTIQYHHLIKLRIQRTNERYRSVTGEVLLIGNGPSAESLTLKQIERFRKLGGKIAVMNGFYKSKFASIVVPDYYFISDPDYWSDNIENTHENLKLRNYLTSIHEFVTIVQPASKEKLIEKKADYLFFDPRSLAGVANFLSPLKPWCLTESVTLKSIIMLKHLGFSCVFFTGLDSVISRSFYVDHLNILHWSFTNHYFYSKDKSENTQTSLSMENSMFFRNFSDVLIADGIFRKDFYKVARNCINISNDETNDVAPRASLLSF